MIREMFVALCNIFDDDLLHRIAHPTLEGRHGPSPADQAKIQDFYYANILNSHTRLVPRHQDTTKEPSTDDATDRSPPNYYRLYPEDVTALSREIRLRTKNLTTHDMPYKYTFFVHRCCRRPLDP